MKLSDVKPTAKSVIEAALPTFAPVLLQDGVTDLSMTIDAALQTAGVCVVLGPIRWDQVQPGDTAQLLVATLTFGIFEQPDVTHTPVTEALVEAVINSLTDRNNFIAGKGEPQALEKGAVLTLCECHALVVFNG